MSTATIGKLGAHPDGAVIPTGGDPATPTVRQFLTAPGDAAQWRSSAPEIDVRDQTWDRAPVRTHRPGMTARRAA